MRADALGLLELKQVARGIAALDAMAKNASVEVLSAGPVCPGKYLAIVRGDVSSVRAAIETAEAHSVGLLYDSLVVGSLHEDVFPAVCGLGSRPKIGDSIGLVETFSAASAVKAADAAVKAAGVTLVDVRLSRGMGGRAFVLFSGGVGACQAAVDAAAGLVAADGLLAEAAVIASPHADLLAAL